jgi:predicted transcriptional regulator
VRFSNEQTYNTCHWQDCQYLLDVIFSLTIGAIGKYDLIMNEVQELIAELQRKGWTLAAIADELGVDDATVYRWLNGLRSPANAVGVIAVLTGLLRRRRVPKRRRYTGRRNPPAT